MLFEQIARNKRRTIYVLIGFVLLLIAIGFALGYVFYDNGVIGMIAAVVVAAIYCGIMIDQAERPTVHIVTHDEVVARRKHGENCINSS